MIDAATRAKIVGRLRRIGGQVQGLQRMVEDDEACADILLQFAAVRGAVEQAQRVLLWHHVESRLAEAARSTSARERQKRMEELREIFSKFTGR